METERQYLTPIFDDKEPELEITWTNLKMELLSDYDTIKVYECKGIGNNGREYTAKSIFIDDVYDSVEEIEIIPH
jgi:hypothetical protein